jgi:putative transposase
MYHTVSSPDAHTLASMSHFRRVRSGRTYFFTLVAFRRRTILCDDAIRSSLRSAFDRTRLRRPFSIDAIVLMPDHLHCIWTLPDGDTDISTRWAQIKHHVSFSCRDQYDDILPTESRRRRGESAIWQRRFWEHQIRDDDDMTRHVDYIHYNPVRHGHVTSAAQWPYSSFGRFVKNGIYPPDWGGTEAARTMMLE